MNISIFLFGLLPLQCMSQTVSMNGSWWQQADLKVSGAELGLAVGDLAKITTPKDTWVSTTWGSISIDCGRDQLFTIQKSDRAESVCPVTSIGTWTDTISISVHARDWTATNASGDVSVEKYTDEEDGGEDDDSGNDEDGGEEDQSDYTNCYEFEIDGTNTWWKQEDLRNVNASTLGIKRGDKVLIKSPGHLQFGSSWGTMVFNMCEHEADGHHNTSECTLDSTATWTTILSLGFNVNELSDLNKGTAYICTEDKNAGDKGKDDDEKEGDDEKEDDDEEDEDGYVDDSEDDEDNEGKDEKEDDDKEEEGEKEDDDKEDQDDEEEEGDGHYEEEDDGQDEEDDDGHYEEEDDSQDEEEIGVGAYNHGEVIITIDDVPTSFYLTSVASSTQGYYNIVDISDDKNTFTLDGGGNIQLTVEPTDVYTPNIFSKIKLLGKEFTYTVDRSAVGCACNSAVYLVAMPGYNADQKLETSEWGNYYCDAAGVPGVFCPEMDISEANRFTMASVPHRCNAPDGKYYDYCHHAGCGTNIGNLSEDEMCPYSYCTIDTTKPYTHGTAFETDSSGFLSGIKNTLTQEDRSYSFYTCGDSGYLLDMTKYLEDNMTLIFSQWGGERDTMSWLDGMTGCDEDCALDQAISIFSDVKLKTI